MLRKKKEKKVYNNAPYPAISWYIIVIYYLLNPNPNLQHDHVNAMVIYVSNGQASILSIFSVWNLINWVYVHVISNVELYMVTYFRIWNGVPVHETLKK